MGDVTASFAYDAFGNNLGDAPGGAGEYLYTGKLFDRLTGLADFGFRDYQPHTGRFTTLDPLRDGLNWYALCGNDPVNYIDLLGLCKDKPVIDWGLPEIDSLDIIPTIPTLPTNGREAADYAKAALNGLIGIPNSVVAVANTAIDNSNYILQNGIEAYLAKGLENTVNGIASNSNAAYNYLTTTPVQQMVDDAKNAATSPNALEKAITVGGTIAIGAVVTTVHGNSLKSLKPTWGYKLYEKDGVFLKNGITSNIIPESRYTKTFMSNKYMEVKIFPNRLEAYKWEYKENLANPGPLNFENYIR